MEEENDGGRRNKFISIAVAAVVIIGINLWRANDKIESSPIQRESESKERMMQEYARSPQWQEVVNQAIDNTIDSLVSDPERADSLRKKIKRMRDVNDSVK